MMQNYGTKLSCDKSKVSYFEILKFYKALIYSVIIIVVNFISAHCCKKFHVCGFS